MTKSLPSPTKPSRVSVPVSAEVLEAFQRMAKAGNMSTGKAMASWLEDTLDSVKYMAETMEKTRQAPRVVAEKLHLYAHALTDESGRFIDELTAWKVRGGGGEPEPATRAAATSPPSCNTGGKVPRKQGRRGAGGAS